MTPELTKLMEEIAEKKSVEYQQLLCSKNYSGKDSIQNGNSAADYKVGLIAGFTAAIQAMEEQQKQAKIAYLHKANEHYLTEEEFNEDLSEDPRIAKSYLKFREVK